MRTAQCYITDDDHVFWKADEALAHEAGCARVAAIMAPLPRRTEDMRSGDVVQHDPATVRQTTLALLRYVQETCVNHPWVQQAIDRVTEGRSVRAHGAGRIISECCPPYVDRAWFRFMSIDSTGREWDQPWAADEADGLHG